MFWLQRTKEDDQDTVWAISYADMVTLLLAIFVMLAAMGDFKASGRFATVRHAVQSAFGFEPAAPEPAVAQWPKVPTLGEQLARAGLIPRPGRLAKADDEVLHCCDISAQTDRVTIRIAGTATFDAFSAALKPTGLQAIQRIAAFLREGKAVVEIRGHGGDGPAPDRSIYRDGLDLSYGRARCVVDVLAGAGVERKRLFVSACGDQDPLIPQAADGSFSAANRRIEIVVHAVQVTQGNDQVAEKGHVHAQ